jgi:NADPH:quinone reductase-like Zn-dependent oxidoreductase
MRTAVIYNPGGPGNFVIEERPIPAVEKDNVLVRVKAFGLNRSELITRKGFSPSVKFPRVLGIECVGEVEDDPTGKFQKGQRVAAFMGEMGRQYDGSYAEYAALPKDILIPFESNLSWETLGAAPEMFQTVFGSLHLALNIAKEEVLLIRGGTSSIGMLAMQMAKNHGLKVIATTRRSEKVSLLSSNGADDVLIDDGNLSEQIKSKYNSGVDKVLELVGTSTLKDSLKCVRSGGVVCMTGMLSEQWSIKDFSPMDFIPAGVYLTVYDSGQIRIEAMHFQSFINEVEKGNISLNISKVFSLQQIADAHELMESNRASGKIVVLP